MRTLYVVVVASLGFSCCSNGLAGTTGLDQRFGVGGVAMLGATASAAQITRVKGIAVQPDGKILLAGAVVGQLPSPWLMPAVGRLTAEGAWDDTFADHGLFVLGPSSVDAPNGGALDRVAVLSDGSLVAAGGTYRQAFGGSFHSCTLLFKLHADGSIDDSFGGHGSGSLCFDFGPEDPNTSYLAHVDDIKLGAGDSIYLSSPAAAQGGQLLARFTSAGLPDSGFGVAGVASVAPGAYAWLNALSADQAVVAIGSRQLSSSSWVVAAARFDSSGTLDAAYGTNGELDLDLLDNGQINPADAALDEDNRLLIGDNDGGFDLSYRLIRLTAGGAVDTGFNGSGQQAGFPGVAKLSLTGSDGDQLIAARPVLGKRILVVGGIPSGSGNSASNKIALIRLNDDAGFDTTFGDVEHPGWAALDIAGGTSPLNRAYSMTFDSQGRALVGANFSSPDGSTVCAGVIRIITDELFGGSFEVSVPWPVCAPRGRAHLVFRSIVSAVFGCSTSRSDIRADVRNGMACGRGFSYDAPADSIRAPWILR